MIPSDIKFDGNATPPQFTDNADQVIERGTHIRVKIKGIRGEVGQMYAIATIKEDFLGYDFTVLFVACDMPLTSILDPFSRLESCCHKKCINQLRKFTNQQKQSNLPCKEERAYKTQDSLFLRSRHRRDATSEQRSCFIFPSFGEQIRERRHK
jgi:hypothetical protein